MKRRIYVKNLEIANLTAEYSAIAENYAQTILNMGTSSESKISENVNMVMSFRKSNESQQVKQRKHTFGGQERSSREDGEKN